VGRDLGVNAGLGVEVGVGVGVEVGVGVGGAYKNVQVNSGTQPLRQKKAQAAMWIVFWPCTAGEVLK
jgi:hypothetical protein